MRIVLSIFVLLISAVFISTSAPTVFLGDSGEMVSAAHCLGIGHPPGYPLYMLVAKIFTFLPLGDAAFRVNLFSSFFGALAFLAVYFLSLCLLRQVFKDKENTTMKLAAALASLIYVFSYIFWFQAGNAKGGLYVMTQFFELLAMLSCAKFVLEKNTRYFYLSAYLSGFLPAIHQSSSLIAVFIVFTLIFNMKKLKPKQAVSGMGLFVLSFFSPYLYLFIRANAQPDVCWAGISTTGEVMSHIIRKIYSVLPHAPFSMDVLGFKLKHYLGQFIYCYRPGVVLAPAGLVFLFLNKRRVFYWAFAFIAANLAGIIYFTGYSFSPFSVYMNSNFYMVVDAAIMPLMALGLYGTIALAPKKYRLVVAAACFILPAWMLFSNYQANNQSRKFLAYDNAMNDLKTLNDGDMLFAEEDFQVFNLLYLVYVKNMRPGVTVYDRSINLLDTSVYREYRKAGIESRLKLKAEGPEQLDFYRLQFTQKLERTAELKKALQNPGRVYYTTLAGFSGENLSTVPYGILNKLVNTGVKQASGLAFMRLYSLRDYYNFRKLDLYHREVIARYFVQYAKYAAIKGQPAAFNRFINMAVDMAPDSGPVLNLISSVYYYDMKDTALAIKYMEKTIGLNPYDYGALDVLVHFCIEADKAKAIEWLKYYFTIAPNKYMQDNILIQLSKLQGGK